MLRYLRDSQTKAINGLGLQLSWDRYVPGSTGNRDALLVSLQHKRSMMPPIT